MSLSRSTPSGDADIRKVEDRIREEEARQRRLVLQGVPTQAGDDVIRQLRQTLQRMRTQGRPTWR
jgi:hypothetical protein